MSERGRRWAVVDESLRVGDGLYVLAAVIVDERQCEAHRKSYAACCSDANGACTGATSGMLAETTS